MAKKFFNFLMEEHDAGVTAEEMTFKERFLFGHVYDEDTEIYWRTGVSFNLVASISIILMTAILLGQRFMV